MRYVAVGSMVVAALAVSAFAMSKSEERAVANNPVQKLVRVQNKSDIKVRIRCLGYEQDHNFTRDLVPGQREIVTGVDTGPRVIVVFKQGGGEIIAKKGFPLEPDGKNADVVIRGDKADGYQVEINYTDF